MAAIEECSKFKRYIWDDPSLCNNCYRKVQRDKELLKTEDGVVMYGFDTDDEEKGGIYRAQAFCSYCGSGGCQSIPEEVSQDTLLKRLDRIILQLEQMDVDPEEDVMRAVVHERKRESESQGRDPEILAEAVERGL